MDLSQLTDEQLEAYQSLRQRREAQNNAPGIKNPVNAETLGKPNAIEKFGQEHPYVSGALALVPGIGALSPNAGDVGVGALKGMGRNAYDVAKTAGPIGLAAGAVAHKLGVDPKVEAATEPTNEGQRVGQVAETAAEMALPAPRILRALPIHADRAAQNFEKAMALAKDVPVDTSKFAAPVLRAQELHENARMVRPGIIKKALQDIGPTTEPLTYRQARDMASAAGELSANEASRLKRPMKAQVSGLARGLDEANAEAAGKAGAAKEYGEAMREYRNAKRLEKAGEYGKKAAIGLASGYGAYEVGKPLVKKALGGK
jgi:hypothetical protein